MAVAFHVLAHRAPQKVADLVHVLWAPENTYVIHYDGSRPRTEHATLHAAIRHFPNVIVQKSTRVLWGRFSLCAAQYEGLRLALESERPWTHWVNLSGQCFPLHSSGRIGSMLAAAGESSFVRHFRPLVEGDWPSPSDRITRRYLDWPKLEWLLRRPFIGRRLRRLFGGESALPSLPGIRVPLPTQFTWYGGDNWVILSRRAAEHLIGSPMAKAIVERLRRSGFPDESIFSR